jgi:hypothetical protein
MIEYRVKWCKCPHNNNESRYLFVEANNAEDAKAIAMDHIQRKYGIEWFSIFSADAVGELPPGQVKEG